MCSSDLIVSLCRLCPIFYFTMLKESNCDEMMKNINVQHKVEHYQKYEKIEDLSPRVCTSVRECNPVCCLVFFPSTWRFWKNILNTRYSSSRCCFWTRNQSYSGDFGSRNIASIIVPRRSSSDSLSPAMILESCALNVGLPIGFLAVITWAVVAAPLPLLPPLPLPRPGRLGNVVARMLHPLAGM